MDVITYIQRLEERIEKLELMIAENYNFCYESRDNISKKIEHLDGRIKENTNEIQKINHNIVESWHLDDQIEHLKN